jgi:hypothetical protein
MSELEKLKRQHKALTEKMGELEAEALVKSREFGLLTHTSKSDPSYSSAKLENLTKDLDRLKEQRADLRAGLDDLELKIRLESIEHTPAQRAAMTTQAAKDARHTELEGDLERTRLVLAERKANLGKSVFEGEDPGVLVAEIEYLQSLESGLLAGLAYK